MEYSLWGVVSRCDCVVEALANDLLKVEPLGTGLPSSRICMCFVNNFCAQYSNVVIRYLMVPCLAGVAGQNLDRGVLIANILFFYIVAQM